MDQVRVHLQYLVLGRRGRSTIIAIRFSSVREALKARNARSDQGRLNSSVLQHFDRLAYSIRLWMRLIVIRGSFWLFVPRVPPHGDCFGKSQLGATTAWKLDAFTFLNICGRAQLGAVMWRLVSGTAASCTPAAALMTDVVRASKFVCLHVTMVFAALP